MIYVLIVAWVSYSAPAGYAVTAEFDSKSACLAAAAEIKRQEKPIVVLCAAKGEKN